jgi:hypothetical protein
MFDRSVFDTAPAAAVQGKTCTGLVYGNDASCRRCGTFHTAPALLLKETDRTDFAASRIADAADLRDTGMCGILIDMDGKVAIAVSGKADKGAKALQAAKGLGVALYTGAVLAGAITLSDYADLGEVGHCKTDGAAEPGNCAAPKLINHAKKNGWRAPFVISEVWSARKGKATDKFAKNEPIESCQACAKLLPLMLCTKAKGTVG